MAVTPEGMVLSYEESALTGMEGTTTTFEVRGPQVILTRSGGVNSQMIFEEGRQHTSLYETPVGELTVDIQTSRLRHNLTDRGGVMEIKYSIAVEHTVTGRNCFKIRVRRLLGSLPAAGGDDGGLGPGALLYRWRPPPTAARHQRWSYQDR